MPVILESMLISLAMTLILELLFALLCRIRSGRDIFLVVAVNVLTNPAVVCTYNLAKSCNSVRNTFLLASLEIAAVLAEWLCYKSCSDDIRRPFLFSLGANVFSFGVGKLISTLI